MLENALLSTEILRHYKNGAMAIQITHKRQFKWTKAD